MKVKRVSMTESCGSLNVPVRARLGSVVIAQRAFDFASSWAPCEREDVLPAVDPLPLEAVGTIGQSVQFDYSLDGGATWKWFGAARPTKWYVVPDMYGLVPPGERYDLGLEKVLEYARGAISSESIARRLNVGIAAELCYDPGEADPEQNRILDVYSKGKAQCSGHALLLEYLCLSAGVSATRLFSWGGLVGDRADLYFMQGEAPDGQVASFQLRARRNDRVGPDPHFTFHAVGQVAELICDAAYGTTWIADAIELYPGASQWTGSVLPSDAFVHNWECEHPCVPLGPCP